MQKCLLQNSVIKQKMCKKKVAQVATNYTFLKSISPRKCKCAKFFKPKCLLRRTENVQISFKGVCVQIYAKFLCKICANCNLLSKFCYSVSKEL